jgi:hypothetical protein
MAFRFGDETVVVDLPQFVAADAYAFSAAARPGVGSDNVQRNSTDRREHVRVRRRGQSCRSSRLLLVENRLVLELVPLRGGSGRGNSTAFAIGSYDNPTVNGDFSAFLSGEV